MKAAEVSNSDSRVSAQITSRSIFKKGNLIGSPPRPPPSRAVTCQSAKGGSWRNVLAWLSISLPGIRKQCFSTTQLICFALSQRLTQHICFCFYALGAWSTHSDNFGRPNARLGRQGHWPHIRLQWTLRLWKIVCATIEMNGYFRFLVQKSCSGRRSLVRRVWLIGLKITPLIPTLTLPLSATIIFPYL